MRFRIDIPPGINTDDTSNSYPGSFDYGSNVRFWKGKWQTVGGWESYYSGTLPGVCRSVLPFRDNSFVQNIVFGQHDHLSILKDYVLYDITPTKALPKVYLGANPLSVTNATPDVVVTQAGHPYIVGDSVIVAGATAVGGITPNGTFTVTATTTDTFTYVFTSNATSTSTGGGSDVTITPQRAWTGGAIDGTGGAGYGTGTYSTGYYSAPSTAAFYPATWALSNRGQNVVAAFRGGTIYLWENDTGVKAAPIDNAPAQVTYALVTAQRQIMALGCNMATSGTFNPMAIRFTDPEFPTVWKAESDNLAEQVILEGGSFIVAGRVVGDYVFVWTNSALHVGRFTGDESQPWVFEQVGDNCGLIGPGAAAVGGQTAYWLTPQGRFFACSVGGVPQQITVMVGDDVVNNLAPSQNDKIVAATNTKFNEVWFFYADARDGNEISRYVSLSMDGATASLGDIARTAYADSGAASDQYPVGVTFGGTVYLHEKGNSADGGALNWSVRSSYFALTEDARVMAIRGFWPDIKDQVGPVHVTIETGLYPQSTLTSNGPYTTVAGAEKYDLRVTGRMVRITWSGNSAPSFARQGVPLFDAVLAGDR
ncbi:hypothetical protein [Caulobacter segnis]